jgi:DNA (cytosine-5)-methyltransferase 1
MVIKHYDLFAGIGGFSLALDTVFYEQKNEHIFCEWEAFPTAVLKKHWPDATYYGDIADLVADTASKGLEGSTGAELQGDSDGLTRNFTILTGGFPCQPFSHAGRRQGTADDRYLWPSMFAVIQNVRPDWVIAENVAGLNSMVQYSSDLEVEGKEYLTEQDARIACEKSHAEGQRYRTGTGVLGAVVGDLEREGYSVQTFIIPAVAIGAPHRRDRVWIIAHNRGAGLEEAGTEQQTAGSWGDSEQPTPNPRQQLREQGSSEGVETDTTIGATRTETNKREYQYTWADDWREVAFATCYDSVDDGLPRWMDGITISGAKYRKEALKACGNAIVPQVAMEIFRAIKATI